MITYDEFIETRKTELQQQAQLVLNALDAQLRFGRPICRVVIDDKHFADIGFILDLVEEMLHEYGWSIDFCDSLSFLTYEIGLKKWTN